MLTKIEYSHYVSLEAMYLEVVYLEAVLYIYNVYHDLSFRAELLRSCKFRQLVNINEGLGLLKLANTVLILINPSPSNVKF